MASLLTLFVTPALYDLMARFTQPINAVEKELERALSAHAAPPAE
jgi:multidrug efflux pump